MWYLTDLFLCEYLRIFSLLRRRPRVYSYRSVDQNLHYLEPGFVVDQPKLLQTPCEGDHAAYPKTSQTYIPNLQQCPTMTLSDPRWRGLTKTVQDQYCLIFQPQHEIVGRVLAEKEKTVLSLK